MKSVHIAKIGENRNAPRVWLEGGALKAAGFEAGKQFDVLLDNEKKSIRLTVCENGTRIVSMRKRNDKVVPIIDINSSQLLECFSGMNSVKVIFDNDTIYIVPVPSENKRIERESRLMELIKSGQSIPCGSISHGGGILDHALHSGFESVGIKTNLAWANDISAEMLEHAQEHNSLWDKNTVSLAMPMQELAWDFDTLNALPETLFLAAGIPCQGASVAGRAKKGTACAEQHENVGHLVAAFLAIIGKLNPAIILIENVLPYQSSASMWIIRNQLRDFGYTLHEEVLNADDWNVLENRSRLCAVAVSSGLNFNFSELSRPEKEQKRLGDILDDVPLDDSRWSEMKGLLAKQERDIADGKGFQMQVCDADSVKVPTIGAGYAKVRSTEIKVRHPVNKNLMRQVTVKEHARCKMIPETLISDNVSLTFGHQLLGQSICYPPFVAVGELIGKCLLNLKSVFKNIQVKSNSNAAYQVELF